MTSPIAHPNTTDTDIDSTFACGQPSYVQSGILETSDFTTKERGMLSGHDFVVV